MPRAAAFGVVLLATAVFVGLARGEEQSSVRTRVLTCPGRSFTFAFHPLLGASVRTGARELVSVSARGWIVSRACKSISRGQGFTTPAEPRFNVYRPMTLRCRVAGRLVIYLAAVRTRHEKLVGRNVVVASGDPAKVVVGAVLTNRPVDRRDRLGPFLYRNPSNCRG